MLGVCLFVALFAFAEVIQEGGRGASASFFCPSRDVGHDAQTQQEFMKNGAKGNPHPCLSCQLQDRAVG